MALHNECFQVGRCCLGVRFNFQWMYLRPKHKCTIFKEIVHPVCGVFDKETDQYVCLPCNDTILKNRKSDTTSYISLPLHPKDSNFKVCSVINTRTPSLNSVPVQPLPISTGKNNPSDIS